ncbi:phage tail tape measure protein [Clavibacter californiensis]|uniref:Phage tail tape measure protein n=1 Tax=Clavibacter californiensis TaxID=1401995 RepID=A0ABX9N9M1_9MICO|nr:phage tail tape measure protein [Clavibacter californiensis]RII94561.1 phage tail tape measure protein [Clavibacter californiensis]UKF78899.1 phage tail tape measure protein [Clavibacter californiensis]
MADRSVFVTIGAKVDGFITGLKKAQEQTTQFSNKLAVHVQKNEQAFTTAGTGLVALGGVGVLAAGAAIAKYAEFDKAMSEVQAATHSAAEEQNVLREAALEAGASTKYSATEAAGAIEELAKAGISTADILSGGLSGALDLAAAGGLGVADAAGIASTALTQFKLAGSDIPHVADLLSAGAGKAMGSVQDLSGALNQAGLVSSQTGLSIEETTAGLSAFASAGLLGSDAGTSFKSMLQRLTPQSAEAQAAMDKLGISAYDSQGEFIGLSEFAGNLQTSLADLSVEQRNSALATIFGSDAVRAASVLYSEGASGIADWEGKVNDSGYAAETARIRMDNLAGDVEKLGGSFETNLIKSGSGANDAIRGLVQTTTGLLDLVGGLPAPVLSAGTAILGIGGSIALAGGAALVAAPKVLAFKEAVSLTGIKGKAAALGVGAFGGAIGIAVLVIGGIVSAAADAAAQVSELSDTFDESTGAITELTRVTIAKRLADDGVFETAKKAGIGQKEFTDAILEGGKALDDVQDKIDAYGTTSLVPWSEKDAAARQLSGALGEQSDQLDKAKEKNENLSAATESNTESTQSAAEAYLAAADEAAGVVDQIKQLIDATNEANGVGQDAVSANASYQKSLQDVKDTIQKAKEGAEGYSTSLDETTAAGSANAAMLGGLADDSQKAAAAQYDLDVKTMSAKDATDKYKASLESGRQTLYDNALALTGNAQQAQAFTDKVYGIPSQKSFQLLADTAAAANEVDTFFRTWNGRRIVMRVETTGAANPVQGGAAGPRAIMKADGGVVDFYAAGGIRENHVAQIAKAGTWRVWAEDETGGEAYIPLAASKRARSLEIFKETGRRLGVQEFANGGVYAPRPVYDRPAQMYMTAPAVAVAPQFNVIVQSKGGIDLTQYIDVRLERADAQAELAGRMGRQVR